MDWKRKGWPDATFEVRSAKCDLRNEQQREKREESRERRGSKEAMVRAQNGGMVQKRVGP